MTVLGIAALAVLSALGAPGAREHLQWQAPAGCPDAESVHTNLEDLTGNSAALNFDVRGVVEPSEAGYRLRLAVDHPTEPSVRTLEATDCALLSRAAALIIALDLDPIATTHRNLHPAPVPPIQAPAEASPTKAPAARTETGTRQPETASRSAPSPIPAPPEQDPAELHWGHGAEASLSAGIGVQLTPRTTGGIEGMVGWRYGPLRVRVQAQHWFRTTQMLEPGAGIIAGLSGAGVRTCYAVLSSRLEIPMCVGADAAALHGRGVGVLVEGRRFAEPWVAAALEVGLEVKLRPRISLPVRLGIVVPLLRSRVHLVRDGTPAEVFQAPALGLRLVAGAGFRSR